MSTIKQFEDIIAWQKARAFSKQLYQIVVHSDLQNDYKLRQQIEGSAGSIMDNIAEGFERGGNKEFINFLTYAKGSCGETRSQLYRLLDRTYIDDETFTALKAELINISNLIGGLIKYLKSSELKGWKFKEDEAIYQTQSQNTEH